MTSRVAPIVLALSFLGCTPAPVPFAPIGLRDAGDRDRDAASIDGEADASPDAAVDGRATFVPEQVYLLGTFAEGAADSVAYEDFDPSTRALAGGRSSDAQHIVTLDGRVLYVDLVEAEVREFVADPWSIDEHGYVDGPSMPAENDPVLPTPACDRTHHLRVDPVTGGFLYACGCGPTIECAFFDEEGNPRPQVSGAALMWPGHGHDLVVTTGRGLLVSDGVTSATVDLDSLPDGSVVTANLSAVRARLDGFRILYPSRDDDQLHAVSIAFDGTATVLGSWSAPEGFNTTLSRCVLDADDHAWCTAIRAEGGDDVVIRLSIGVADPEIVHDEALDPRVKLHGSRLFTGP